MSEEVIAHKVFEFSCALDACTQNLYGPASQARLAALMPEVLAAPADASTLNTTLRFLRANERGSVRGVRPPPRAPSPVPAPVPQLRSPVPPSLERRPKPPPAPRVPYSAEEQAQADAARVAADHVAEWGSQGREILERYKQRSAQSAGDGAGPSGSAAV